MSFGQYLVACREERGISRRKLNELSGLSLSYLHEIETGQYLPGPDNLKKIAKALRIDEEALLRERDMVELGRMGLDPEAALQLKQLGPLSHSERQKFARWFRGVQASR